MLYIKYFIFIIVIIILFILVSHYLNYIQINPELNIQQSEHPINDVIDKMLAKKQPTIFRYELELWDGFDLLLGQQYNDIIHVMQNNKLLESNVQQIYLKPYELPLTRKWDIKCYKITKTWEQLDIKPSLEKSYLHLVSCISGLAMICLISPKHINQINTLINNKTDIKHILTHENKDNTHENKDNINDTHDNINKDSKHDNDNTLWDYITIPLRPSNMIYIPYGWYYYIYSGKNDNYCVLFDTKCITYFG